MTDAMARAIVNEDVPAMLRTIPPASGSATPVGDVITAQLARLRSRGWHVEEMETRPGVSICDEWSRVARSGSDEYVIPVPAHRNREDMWSFDFSRSGMMISWCSWSTWTWETFVEPHPNPKEHFQRITSAQFFRAFTPETDRVYDVVIFRSSEPDRAAIVPEQAFARGVERSARYYQADSQSAPIKERVAELRSSVGPYTAFQQFVSRFFEDPWFFHTTWGKTRTRDGYALALLSPREFVFVQTMPFSDTTREALVADLRAILGAVPLDSPASP
jgi:hypothetical protein